MKPHKKNATDLDYHSMLRQTSASLVSLFKIPSDVQICTEETKIIGNLKTIFSCIFIWCSIKCPIKKYSEFFKSLFTWTCKPRRFCNNARISWNKNLNWGESHNDGNVSLTISLFSILFFARTLTFGKKTVLEQIFDYIPANSKLNYTYLS